MPANIYGPRQLVWVNPFTGATIKYGFMTNADTGTRTILGHVEVTGTNPAGLVIGANAPKPPRGKKLSATGTESSFCDAEARTAARAAGWRISPGKIRIGSSGSKSKTVYVTHEGNKLAWKMPNYLYANITGDLAGLGIVLATSTDKDLVFGARFPILPRVGRVGATFNKYTTFCDPSKLDSLPTGWSSVRASEDSD